MRLTVRVPATVANLGPAFDAMALAVDVVNEVMLDTEGEPGVRVDGEGVGELPQGPANLVVRSMAALGQQEGAALPPFAMRCMNRVPLARGLGSSASAVVAGLALADRVLGTALGADRLLEMAVDLEGHADNVAAAIHGGVVVAYLSDGGWRVEPIVPAPGLRPVLLVPEHERVSTQDARRVLAPEVPRSAATFNAARSALLALALSGRSALLPDAMEDRLHQDARLRLAPASRALFADLRDAGIPACVAGSGPSLLAFEDDDRTVPALGPGWRVVRTTIRTTGLDLEER